MTVNNAYLVSFSIAGNRVIGITDQSLDIAMSTIPITTKDSSGWAEKLADEGSGSGSLSCLLDESAAYAFADIFTAIAAKTSVACTYGKGITTINTELISFSAILTGLSRTDPNNSASGYTLTYEMTGTPTNGTSAATLA